jgi:hypothetical protein
LQRFRFLLDAQIGQLPPSATRRLLNVAKKVLDGVTARRPQQLIVTGI